MKAFLLITLLWGPDLAFVDLQACSGHGLVIVKSWIFEISKQEIRWENCLSGFIFPIVMVYLGSCEADIGKK